MQDKLTKAKLIETLSITSGVPRKEIHAFIDDFWDELKKDLLAGNTIELRGFGTFEIKHRKGRNRARNPKTGEIVSVADHGVAFFRPGRELKKAAWHTKH